MSSQIKTKTYESHNISDSLGNFHRNYLKQSGVKRKEEIIRLHLSNVIH